MVNGLVLLGSFVGPILNNPFSVNVKFWLGYLERGFPCQIGVAAGQHGKEDGVHGATGILPERLSSGFGSHTLISRFKNDKNEREWPQASGLSTYYSVAGRESVTTHVTGPAGHEKFFFSYHVGAYSANTCILSIIDRIDVDQITLELYLARIIRRLGEL